MEWLIVYDAEDSLPIQVASSGYHSTLPLPARFRLLDEDDMIIFEGYAEEGTAYEPLTDFGRQRACERISYYDITTDSWYEL